jgi:hypothetical protein
VCVSDFAWDGNQEWSVLGLLFFKDGFKRRRNSSRCVRAYTDCDWNVIRWEKNFDHSLPHFGWSMVSLGKTQSFPLLWVSLLRAFTTWFLLRARASKPFEQFALAFVLSASHFGPMSKKTRRAALKATSFFCHNLSIQDRFQEKQFLNSCVPTGFLAHHGSLSLDILRKSVLRL